MGKGGGGGVDRRASGVGELNIDVKTQRQRVFKEVGGGLV